MSPKSRDPKSAFIAAAESFDDELANFQRTVEATLRAPLNSAKQLERATQTLNQLAQCEQRLGDASQALSQAISQAHEQQLAQTKQASEKAHAIAVRTAQFQQIMQGYQALGVAGMALNSEAAALAGRKKDLAGAAAEVAWTDDVLALQGKLSAVASTAQELIQTARGNDFEDIARQAESIRQQLLAARNKLAVFSRGPSEA